MKIVNWREWSLRCDEEATERAYRAVTKGGADGCTCAYCRNYVQARESLYPAEILRLFSELNVDYRKEAEACQYNRVRPGVRLCGVWYHFVGNVLKGKDRVITLPSGATQMRPDRFTESLEIWFWERSDLAHASFKGLPLVQMDFTLEVPWVLDEPEPE
jgi:hypothetical protein